MGSEPRDLRIMSFGFAPDGMGTIDPAREHPCPKGQKCALNRGVVLCKHCNRPWPPEGTRND